MSRLRCAIPQFRPVIVITVLLGALAFLPLASSAPVSRRELWKRATTWLSEDGTIQCIIPAPKTQILLFFLTNYITRIATFKKTSGYEGYRDYLQASMTLFVPFIGISQAAGTIARGAYFLGKDNLGHALFAEALVCLVRGNGWRPEDGEIVRGCIIEKGIKKKKRKHKRRGEKSRSKTREKRRRADSDPRPSTNELLSSSSSGYSGDHEDDFSHPCTLLVERSGLQLIAAPHKWKIQGFHTLPDSYALATVPPGTQLQPVCRPNSIAQRSDIELSCNYGVVKSFAGIVQIVSSLYSLYSAYTTQLDRYGYAAVAFSVLPYTMMSILNTVANLMEASYDCLFLVRSDVMNEAESREGGEFIGEIAELVPLSRLTEEKMGIEVVDLMFRYVRDQRRWIAFEVNADTGEKKNTPHYFKVKIPSIDDEHPETLPDIPATETKLVIPSSGQLYEFNRRQHHRAQKWRRRSVFIIIIIALIFPYIVIGILSKFKPGRSSIRRRIFMMAWLCTGQFIGALDLVSTRAGRKIWWWWWAERAVEISVVVIGFAMAIGGFYESVSMLRESGYCFKL